jgi:tripartite-type tricarboxylate transporter receptor subunit TctC
MLAPRFFSSGSIEHIRADRLRALAVTTVTRSEILPDLPTVGEFVPGFESSIWFGLSAPRNTPTDIVNKLNREVIAGLADDKIKARYAELGSAVFPTSPAEFSKFIADEVEKWAKVVKFANVKAE